MSSFQIAAQENIMRRLKIGKVVLNIGVGKSGEALERASRVLEELTGQKSSRRNARRTIRDFGIHKGEPIGVIVTLRGDKVVGLLKRLLAVKGMKISSQSFDNRGNCSFGIKEHIEIPGVKYNPDIGIFGIDVSIVVERPGYRSKRRRRAAATVGRSHLVGREDAIRYFKEALGVEVY